jgi:endonuclease/exonuclease/phosphatase family metal-dependent hydrolase
MIRSVVRALARLALAAALLVLAAPASLGADAPPPAAPADAPRDAPAAPAAPAGDSEGDALRLRVLSYNVWGIPLVTPAWRHRVPRIARAVAGTGADVVGLQEVWFRADADAIAREAGYPHARYFDEAGRTGLLVLSRFPIEAPRVAHYGANGFPFDILKGEADWFAAKGIATMTLRTPLGPLPFAGTHMISAHRRGKERTDLCIAHRATQVLDAIDALRRLRAEVAASAGPGGALPLVVTGDLNCRIPSDEMALLTSALALRGAQHDAARTPEERAISWNEIDHVLFGEAPGFAVEVERVEIRPSGTVDGPSGAPVRLSDHEGVLADLVIRRLAPGAPPPAPAPAGPAPSGEAAREAFAREIGAMGRDPAAWRVERERRIEEAKARLRPLLEADARTPRPLTLSAALASVLAIGAAVRTLRRREDPAAPPAGRLRRAAGALGLLALAAAVALVLAAALLDAPRSAAHVRASIERLERLSLDPPLGG